MPESYLPEYKVSHLIEVVCGVQFAAIQGFASVHFGEFWQQVRSEYPTTEDKPPLPEIVDQPQVPGTFSIESLSEMPLPRVFFIDHSGSNLLQVQSTRFHANWRRLGEGEEYPRFHAAYGRFTKGWKDFQKFLVDSSLPPPKVKQYELTYINHIPVETPAEIERHLPLFAWTAGRACRYLPEPRGVTMRMETPLEAVKGGLHIGASFARRLQDGQGLMVLELTARGPSLDDGSDVGAWFDGAHRNVVLGFADIISQASQNSWGVTERRGP